jgi:hypothetical protein
MELAMTSQLFLLMGSPWGAKPHDQLLLKYHPTPFALCGVLPVPVSNVTSARGACAATESVVDPVGRQASSRLALLQVARIVDKLGDVVP